WQCLEEALWHLCRSMFSIRCSMFGLQFRRSSPPEKPIRIIPLIRLVDVKTRQPPFLVVCRACRLLEPFKQRRRGGHSHVRHQSRKREGQPTVGSSEVLLGRHELPRCKLAQDDMVVRNGRQNAIADYLSTITNERQVARVAIMKVSGGDSRQ